MYLDHICKMVTGNRLKSEQLFYPKLTNTFKLYKRQFLLASKLYPFEPKKIFYELLIGDFAGVSMSLRNFGFFVTFGEGFHIYL